MDYCNWSKGDYKISWNPNTDIIKEEQVLEIDTAENSLEITFREVLANCKESTDRIIEFLNITGDTTKIKSYVKRFKLDVDDEFRGDVS